MLRLILSTDWVAVRKEILGRVARDVQQELPGRILLVPELISHDMERRLCACTGDTASRFAQVLSFSRLVRRVTEYCACGPEECMDGGGRMVAMATAARQLHSRLKAYASVETKPEFLTQLVDIVDEFKRCCISPEDLRRASRDAQGSLAQKLEELSLLLETYDSLCTRGKKDPREQMNWLIDKFSDCDFGENHVFYIDGFPDFTRQHMGVLEQLMATSSEITVGLNCDCVDSHALAFEKAGKTALELLSCARRCGIETEIITLPKTDSALHRGCVALFQGALPEGISGMRAVVARSPEEEAQAVLHRAMELVRGGCRYRDIGIVCSDFSRYQDYLRLLFRRCDVPLYLSGTEDIGENSVIATVLAALDAALGGFEQRDIFRYLKSPLSCLDRDSCDDMENYAVLWGIRGKRWQEEWTQHPKELGGLWTEADREKLNKLNNDRVRALTPLFSLRQGIVESKDLHGQVDALLAFLEEIGFDSRLQQLADFLNGQGDSRSAQIMNQLWEILLGALEQMQSVLGQTAWEPEVFVRLLRLLLNQYDVGTIPPVLDAITAGPVSAMRCQQVKHLFVLGADEGALPGYAGSAGLLSDNERTVLRSLGVPLTGGAMEGIQAEFAEIFGVFCGASESVTVLCGSLQPSYVFRRISQMSGGEEKAEQGLEALVMNPWDAGGYLAKFGAQKQAAALGLAEQYEETCRRASYDLGSVSRSNIEGLYGQRLMLSASQIDRQAECRLSYFLKYGLRAKERKEASVDPAEFGSFVHSVLEKCAASVMEKGGFAAVSLEETLSLAQEYARQYIDERFKDIDSNRLQYLFARNQRELEMVVTELWQELKQSRFLPAAFELGFGDNADMAAVDVSGKNMPAALRGFVDRVDIFRDGDKHYFRVVDYKTGRKDFDYCDVYNGVGLQMLLYLFALEDNGNALIGGNPQAAGVQYFPARAPLVSADGKLSDEEAHALWQKQWKRKGLLLHDEEVLNAMEPGEAYSRLSCARKKDGSLSGDLADREQLRLLKGYVFALIGDLVDEIASGKISPNPYTRGLSHSACAYCPYGSICKESREENRRNYKTMEAQRFWEEIERQVHDHG